VKIPKPDLARWTPWVATVAVIIIVVVSVIAYVNPGLFESLPGGSAPSQSGPSVIRGISCQSLEEARVALDEGRSKRVVASLEEAEKKAIQALDEGGIVFGRPEELAVRLNVLPMRRPFSNSLQDRLTEKLEEIHATCEKFT